MRTEAEWKSKSLMQSRLLVTLTAKMILPDTNEDSMKESNCNLPCRDVVEKFPSPFVNSLLERASRTQELRGGGGGAMGRDKLAPTIGREGVDRKFLRGGSVQDASFHSLALTRVPIVLFLLG